MPTVSKKICLIGDFGVGKTSLIRRLVENQFSDEYLSTVGVKISRKSVEVQNREAPIIVQLIIWDLEGRTMLKPIRDQYLRGAHGALIVADLTRSETVERIPEHIDQFLAVNPQGDTVIALNKIDLVDGNPDLRLAGVKNRDANIEVYQTSAKTGERVNEIFEVLVHRIVNKETK